MFPARAAVYSSEPWELYANALYTEITVSDDGEGIACRDVPNIFHCFYREENTGESSAGIGLALRSQR
jgi:signal transduction histidine kinase